MKVINDSDFIKQCPNNCKSMAYLAYEKGDYNKQGRWKGYNKKYGKIATYNSRFSNDWAFDFNDLHFTENSALEKIKPSIITICNSEVCVKFSGTCPTCGKESQWWETYENLD